MSFPFGESEVICSCGDLVREADTLFCDLCGDVACVDCLVEDGSGEGYCTNCASDFQESVQAERDTVINLIIDGKRYSAKGLYSEELLFYSSYQSGFATKLFMNIKGVGKVKYMYRSIYPIYGDGEVELGDLYTLYFEKAV